MIEIKQTRKTFGKRVAVDDLTLDVPAGCIYGLLGHNGAGKSTTLGMLLGQIFPDRGSLKIDGHDVFTERAAALSRVGAIYESPAFYDYLTGYSNLRIFCEYTAKADRKRMDEVIELVNLKDRIRDKVGLYSHGMRQRLALAQALLPNPSLLILDEPSDGLDPQGIHDMRNLVRKLNREYNLTILFSSHLLVEVEQLCDHVAVMHHGKLVFNGQWSTDRVVTKWIRFEIDRQDEAIERMRAEGFIGRILSDGRAELTNGRDTASINRWLHDQGFAVHAIAPVRPTLEDFYLETVGYRENND